MEDALFLSRHSSTHLIEYNLGVGLLLGKVETYKKLGTLSFALAENADNLRIAKHTSTRGQRMIVSFEVLLNAHNKLVQGKHDEAAVLLQHLKDNLTKVSKAEAIYKK